MPAPNGEASAAPGWRATTTHRVIAAHEGAVFGADLALWRAADGRRVVAVASCGDDRAVRAWDVSGQPEPAW